MLALSLRRYPEGSLGLCLLASGFFLVLEGSPCCDTGFCGKTEDKIHLQGIPMPALEALGGLLEQVGYLGPR